jgi:hypothetical protein
MTLINATASLLLGQFGAVTFLGGTTADVNYDLVNGDVFLDNFQSAAIAGDFDVDGDVDGADFLTWQRGLGITGTATVGQGDANGDMNVNAADLAIWRQNFGPGASVAAVGAVPEPAACLLALLSSVALGITGRRR